MHHTMHVLDASGAIQPFWRRWPPKKSFLKPHSNTMTKV